MANRGQSSFPRQGYDDYTNSNNNMADNRIATDDYSTGGPTQTTRLQVPPQQQQQPIPGMFGSSLAFLWTHVNKELFISKIFYFFFFSAFGSLFPLMAVYFKQLGMNAIQAGTLIGIRPFVEFLAAPFWSSIADRFHKSKLFLLFSLVCWIVFTFSLAFIRPPASACVIFNETHHILFTPYSDYNGAGADPNAEPETDISENTNIDSKLSLIRKRRGTDEEDRREEEDEWIRKWGSKHKPPPTHIVGKSPLTVEYTLNYNQEKHVSYVSPPFSTVVYKLDDVKEVFFLLLLLILLGEFFSAPAITLADCATLNYLGENTDNYGKQRMYGSFGWGITMFFVGMALDNSTKFTDHPCGAHIGERNYVTCFTIFAFLMACALVAATQFRFDFEPSGPLTGDDIQMKPYDYEASQARPWLNTAPPINKPPELMAADK
ncbi:unnamed protein product, partial [Medioppia subpectinata]